MHPAIATHSEILIRVGNSHESTLLDINLPTDTRSLGSVLRVHSPSFSNIALTKAEKYRIIFGGQADPLFGIRIEKSGYVPSPMTFGEYEGVAVSTFIPDFESRPRTAMIETCVPIITKGERRINQKTFRRIP